MRPSVTFSGMRHNNAVIRREVLSSGRSVRHGAGWKCRKSGAGGDDRIFGVMIEGHLKSSGSAIRKRDACIGWEETVPLLQEFADAVRARRLKKEEE